MSWELIDTRYEMQDARCEMPCEGSILVAGLNDRWLRFASASASASALAIAGFFAFNLGKRKNSTGWETLHEGEGEGK